MEQRVSIITLGVADLKRSREFYERLGWRQSPAGSDGIVFFQAVGMALALFPRSELAKMRMLRTAPPRSADSPSHITPAVARK